MPRLHLQLSCGRVHAAAAIQAGAIELCHTAGNGGNEKPAPDRTTRRGGTLALAGKHKRPVVW